jgi:murein tripeptide amidase MpaA
VNWNKHLAYDQLYSFNEHARERITGELALQLIKKLKKMKPNRRITIIPILNTGGRRKVENGAPCTRKNNNGVDINRNFQMTSTQHKYARWSEEYEGERPLSEKESQLIASILKKGVKRYVNVHSGEFSL